jgi:hypothetical protein
MWNLCDIYSFIGLYFIYQHVYSCVIQHIIFVCKMYKLMNEQTSHDFHYQVVTC